MKQPVFGLRASLVRTPASSPCVAYSRTVTCMDCVTTQPFWPRRLSRHALLVSAQRGWGPDSELLFAGAHAGEHFHLPSSHNDLQLVLTVP